MKLWSLFWQLITASLLSACVMPVAQHGASGANSRHASADTSCREGDAFAFTARFVLTLVARPDEKTPRQFSGRLEWRRDAEGDRLFITDPFGRGLATLRHPRAGPFFLQQADGVEQSSDDPESLLDETLGASLPLAELAAWVSACPNPGALVETDAAGRPTRARESGWLLAWRYADDDAAAPTDKPNRFDASLESVLKLRLAFEHWEERPTEESPVAAPQDAP
ncbi:MAG: outer membrane lipoprotein LolB [Zoogloeaceae bacterium]|jgi:outer membrane biogenesis lipoprotein LolB|nr:outer membrane lipoprotein LolB [Zoogloeaceae bacterium]